MAINSNFKNANLKDVGTSWQTLYTAPSGKTSYFIHISVASVNGGGQVSVRVYDSSASVSTYTVKGAPVPDGSALPCLIEGNKLVLEPGDYVEVKSESAGILFDVQSSLIEDVNT